VFVQCRRASLVEDFEMNTVNLATPSIGGNPKIAVAALQDRVYGVFAEAILGLPNGLTVLRDGLAGIKRNAEATKRYAGKSQQKKPAPVAGASGFGELRSCTCWKRWTNNPQRCRDANLGWKSVQLRMTVPGHGMYLNSTCQKGTKVLNRD